MSSTEPRPVADGESRQIGPDHFECVVVIPNSMGLHARPASMFVELANQFPCDVVLMKDDEQVDGKSILQLMTLAAEQGTELRLETIGDQAELALASLADLVRRGFDEMDDEPGS